MTKAVRIAEPIPGEADWFVIRSWDEVFQRTGLAPNTVPGVRTVNNHPAAQLAPRSAPEYAKQAGASASPPHPYKVHRSHLSVLGYFVLDDLVDPVDSAQPNGVALRPHQLLGVQFIRARHGTLLADEMRVGKSCTVHYAHESEYGIHVVCGPVAARTIHHEWAARRFGACLDVHEWLQKHPERPVRMEAACGVCARVGAVVRERPSFAILEGRTPDLTILAKRSHVVFLTYAVVSAWSEHFGAFGNIGTLTLDEIHQAGIQDRRNATAIGIKRLTASAHRTVGLTGTPVWNQPDGLWAILDTICPAAFGGYWPYAVRYANARPGPHGWIADGATNTEELEKRLSAIMLRRTWNEIQPGLPPIDRSFEYIPLSDEDHAMVFATANELRKAAGLGRPQTMVGNLARLAQLFAKLKVARAVEIIRETLANGHSMVVWTWHQQVAQDISDRLGAAPYVHGPIHGKTSTAAREFILEDVRGDKSPRLLIATMGSLSTSVSLNWASHELFVELSYTPPVITQAEMRPYDGTQSISSTFLVADCETDRRQTEALLEKAATTSKLGLRPGMGEAAEILAATFGLTNNETLDAVASLILAAESL